jgi:hypothetical protein
VSFFSGSISGAILRTHLGTHPLCLDLSSAVAGRRARFQKKPTKIGISRRFCRSLSAPDTCGTLWVRNDGEGTPIQML